MIDYEFKIRMLEKELAHYREMQDLMRGRLDAHDDSLAGIQNTLARSAAEHDRQMAEIRATVLVIGESLKELIESMKGRATGGNGHPGADGPAV